MVSQLNKLNVSEIDLSKLKDQIKTKQLKCNNRVNVKGDTRFWHVDENTSDILKQFRELAIDKAKEVKGRAFNHTILMVNHITAEDTPEGSGGGWHVDSVQDQYKLFMYLTDCETKQLGPLTLFSSNNTLKDKFHIYKNYFQRNKFRFSESKIEQLKHKGFVEQPILNPALTPFFVNTSFIHRGSKITQGERMLVTAYMFDKIPASIQGRINKSE